jgi:hypothetical protein
MLRDFGLLGDVGHSVMVYVIITFILMLTPAYSIICANLRYVERCVDRMERRQ